MDPDTQDQPQAETPAVETSPQIAPESETVTPEMPAVEPLQSTVMPSKKGMNKFKLSKKSLLIGGGILLAIIIAIGLFFVFRKKPVTSAPASSSSNKKTDLPPAVTVDGSTFLQSAKSVGDLGVIADYSFFSGDTCDGPNYDQNCVPVTKPSDIAYYQIGTSKDGGNIYAFTYSAGIDSGSYILIQSKDGKSYTVIGRHSSIGCLSEQSTVSCDSTLDELKKTFKSNVSVDTTTVFPEFTFEKEVTVKGQKLKLLGSGYFLPKGTASFGGIFSSDKATANKLDTVKQKTFYDVVSKDEPNFTVNDFYASYNNLFGASYEQNGEIAKNSGKLAYNWKTGDKDAVQYFSAGAGCGSAAGFVVAKNVADSDLVLAGTTPGGQKLYQLSTSAPLAQELFTSDYNGGPDVQDDSLKNLTIQQFTDKHAYFLVRNGLDQLMVYQRSDLFIRGGCGKPVVYLYPTKNTPVSVAVGADVRISEPTYPSGGWQNVLATPSGKLTYKGSSYDSLYWEGYGHGQYPNITAGSVVAKKDAVSTIRSQLKQQGLNNTEIDDFMEFWQPRLPDTPYVRLSWLSTAQLNTLAPLQISPKPQSVIRVFLDFEGLDRPISLPTQTLTTPKRQGFTVVEWGGLLRDGLSL